MSASASHVSDRARVREGVVPEASGPAMGACCCCPDAVLPSVEPFESAESVLSTDISSFNAIDYDGVGCCWLLMLSSSKQCCIAEDGPLLGSRRSGNAECRCPVLVAW